MFAGVGTFSMIIAKTKRCEIDSVDINPDAIRLSSETISLNKRMKGTVKPVLADAKEYANQNEGIFDRILMPLPERSSEFLDAAIYSAKRDPGAVIHYYVHVPEGQFYDEEWIKDHLLAMILPRKFEISNWKRVRDVGPRFIQAVADIRLL